MVIGVKLNKEQTTIDDTDAELVELKWYRNSDGYAVHNTVRVVQKHTVILMHRVIMERMLGRSLLSSEEVNHINSDPLDNQRSNLRLVDDRQQRANSKKCSRNKKGDQPSSEYKGVSWSREKGKWKAQKWFNGQCVYCELFDDEIEAAFAYDRASIKYEGEFARLNFPWGLVPPTSPPAKSRSQTGPKQLRYRKPHSSEYYGVFWARRDKKWIAEIRVNNHLIYLGNFDDEVEAARTVDRAAIKYLGAEDAKPKLNFPISDYTETSMVGRIVKDVFSYT